MDAVEEFIGVAIHKIVKSSVVKFSFRNSLNVRTPVLQKPKYSSKPFYLSDARKYGHISNVLWSAF